MECTRAQDWDRASVLGTEKQDVCPGGQSWSGAAGESQTELEASRVIVKSQLGFTKLVGKNDVLRQGSTLPMFVMEGDYFRIYLCMSNGSQGQEKQSPGKRGFHWDYGKENGARQADCRAGNQQALLMVWRQGGRLRKFPRPLIAENSSPCSVGSRGSYALSLPLCLGSKSRLSLCD